MLFNPFPSIVRLAVALIGLALLATYGWSLSHQDVPMDLLARQQPPSLAHWFGTDQMGRDLWLRAFQGTLTSLELGISTALCSGLLAMVAASVSLIHPRCDVAVRLLIDAMLALPHMLLLILICFTVGGGMRGVILAVALTHWPKLALILCAEARRIASGPKRVPGRLLTEVSKGMPVMATSTPVRSFVYFRLKKLSAPDHEFSIIDPFSRVRVKAASVSASPTSLPMLSLP